MIQLQVQFNSPLGPLKPRPVKHFGAQLNDGSIQTPKKMLETKTALLGRR
jgi:hypothetical protein